MDHLVPCYFATTMAPSPVGSEENEEGRIAFGSMLPYPPMYRFAPESFNR
jgi:hypothetical protein